MLFSYEEKILADFQICINVPLSANSTKWLNTIKQVVGSSRRTVLVCLTILWNWRLMCEVCHAVKLTNTIIKSVNPYLHLLSLTCRNSHLDAFYEKNHINSSNETTF